MPQNNPLPSKNKPPFQHNYGLGILIGIITGLIAYFFYGTGSGKRLRQLITDPANEHQGIFHHRISTLRQKIAVWRHRLASFEPSPLKNKNKIAISNKTSRRYFKAKK